jgi:hypothetical protein
MVAGRTNEARVYPQAFAMAAPSGAGTYRYDCGG